MKPGVPKASTHILQLAKAKPGENRTPKQKPNPSGITECLDPVMSGTNRPISKQVFFFVVSTFALVVESLPLSESDMLMGLILTETDKEWERSRPYSSERGIMVSLGKEVAPLSSPGR